MKNRSAACLSLPDINRHLFKDKRYKYKEHNKQNPVKRDLETIIFKLVNNDELIINKWHKHINYINNKVEKSHNKYKLALDYLPNAHQNQEIKRVKIEMIGYLKKLGKQTDSSHQSDYAEFVRLSQESQDYLQYYLKNRFKSDDDFGIVHQKQKKIILSILKNSYKCLNENNLSIVNRIILCLNINPLNDFHFITWNTFYKFRRLALAKQTKMEGRTFLIDYFFINHEKLSKLQFGLILKNILGKLEKIISPNNIERLFDRIIKYSDNFLPQELTKESFYKIIVNQHLFIWSELLQVIFLV